MILRPIRLLAVAATLAASAAGCASSGASSSDTGSQRPRTSANVISADELANSGENDAYSAVQRLRPNFLMTRGITSINQNTGIVVFLDNNRLGDVSTLRQIQVMDVKEIRYFSASEATQRYGTGVPNGAILVTRK